MTQRIQDYLNVKKGSYTEREVANIVKSNKFKTIYEEQLTDFKIDYKKYLTEETPVFIQDYQMRKFKELIH